MTARLVALAALVFPLVAHADPDFTIRIRRDGDSWRAYSYDRRIPHDQLYDLVGRDDLVTRYRWRSISGSLLVTLGICALVGGIAHYYETSAPGAPSEHYADWVTYVPVLGGAAATGLGGLLLIGRDPVTPDQAEQMVRDYNTQVLGRAHVKLTPLGVVGSF